MSEGTATRRSTAALTRGLGALAVLVVLGDQLSKAWAWRHVGRVTVDTGGGVLDGFVGGAANAVMADPVAGAVADVVVAAVLVWSARWLWSRPRSVPVGVTATVLLAACASNLLDRFGVHRFTALGSARGVVNWISLGGGTASPMNVADLLILGAVVTLGAIGLTRFVARREPSRGRRTAVLVAALTMTAVSLVGAVHAADGTRGRHDVTPRSAGWDQVAAGDGTGPAVTGGSGAAAGPTAVDRGAPEVPVSATGVSDDLQRIVTRGASVTVTWTSESVTVAGRSVLGWRSDGVSTQYLHAVVVGPTTMELYLPPVASDGSDAPWCQWRAVPPGPGTAAGSPPVWECNTGQPPLTMAKTPVLFP